jgi:hypothetical protein
MTPRGHNLVTTVEELINPITSNWDENLIRDLFWSVDAHRILQIPLVAGREDLVAWHYNKNGFFYQICLSYTMDTQIRWQFGAGASNWCGRCCSLGNSVEPASSK